ncbi:MAG: hypothetical protein AAFN08_13670, partial [Cyanobacteria bacterium J06559_3]
MNVATDLGKSKFLDLDLNVTETRSSSLRSASTNPIRMTTIMPNFQSVIAAVSVGTAAFLALPAFNQTTNAAANNQDIQAWGALHRAIPAWDTQSG